MKISARYDCMIPPARYDCAAAKRFGFRPTPMGWSKMVFSEKLSRLWLISNDFALRALARGVTQSSKIEWTSQCERFQPCFELLVLHARGLSLLHLEHDLQKSERFSSTVTTCKSLFCLSVKSSLLANSFALRFSFLENQEHSLFTPGLIPPVSISLAHLRLPT